MREGSVFFMGRVGLDEKAFIDSAEPNLEKIKNLNLIHLEKTSE